MLQKLTINLSFLVVIALMALATTPAWSGQVTYADDSYASGDTLTAADMNAKFNELKAMINDNNTRIAVLESELNAINTSNVMALDPYLSVDTLSDPRGPLVQLSGINLQLMNGVGSTTVNGLGNLIIGYDPVRATGSSTCSLGTYTDETNCTTNSETWAISHKTGSHYLVIGDQNNYSQHNGMVVGYQNTVSNQYSSVSGGRGNTASGNRSSVSGGYANTASGNDSSVSGGTTNTASGNSSSVSGGYGGIASSFDSSISGGRNNTASSARSSVSGGVYNIASGNDSSVSGGSGNTASGNSSSVSGGRTSIASGSDSSISGGRNSTASGNRSSISGGYFNIASGDYSSVSGGSSVVISAVYGTDLSGEISTISGDISSINGDINAINTSNMMALDPYLSVDTLSDPRGPLVQLSGINLQLTNGVGSTMVNGLGNLIIGYDPVRIVGSLSCSRGTYTNQTDCEVAGETWALNHKTGSHYLVIGDRNNYSQRSGMVVGFWNTASNEYSSVSGGVSNTASGARSSVSGGYNNTASGNRSSVSGGWANTASGDDSSVSGGQGCGTGAVNYKWVVGGTSSGCSGNAN